MDLSGGASGLPPHRSCIRHKTSPGRMTVQGTSGT